jgi:hypothetical protein
MAFNTFLKIFLPKDRIFYTLFEDSSERVLLMAKKLKDLVLETDKSNVGPLCPTSKTLNMLMMK